MFAFELFWSLVSAATYSLYYILFKKAHNKHIFSFWIITINSIGFFSAFLFKGLYLGEPLPVINSEILHGLCINIPLYLADACALTTSFMLYSYLLKHYRVSQIFPLLQISTPLVAIFYFFLGNPTPAVAVVGIIMISVGAIISGLDTFHVPKNLKPFVSIPLALYLGGLCIVIVDTANILFLYIATQKTAATCLVENFLKTLPGLSSLQLGFTSSLKFYQYSYPFYVLCMLLCLVCFKRYSLYSIWKGLVIDKKIILWGGIADLVTNLIYYYVYQEALDKSLIVAFAQLSVPLTLLFSYLLLKEEISLTQKVGAILIISGGIIGAL